MWKNELRQVLKRHFQSLQKKNPRFSLRSFARQLGVSSGGLSEFMKGDGGWNPSVKKASTIIQSLPLSSRESARLLSLMGVRGALKVIPDRPTSQAFMTDPAYFAVLFGLDLPMAENLDVLRKKWNLSEAKLGRILEFLHENGMVEKTPSGRWRRRPEVWMAPDKVSVELLKKHHVLSLQGAADALTKFPSEERDLSSLTLAGNPRKLALLREEIRAFYERVIHLMEDGNHGENTEVYRMSVSVYPL